MALEHALLVALDEQQASGLELTRRFERSIGFFWHATHQQIYRVLARMEADGWVTKTSVRQQGRPDKLVYALTPAGHGVLSDWLALPTPTEPLRSDLAVKMRGAAAGDRAAVLDVVRCNLADHHARHGHYEQLVERDYPDHEAPTGSLSGRDLDHYLVLRGGLRLEQFWIDWLTEYVSAHEVSTRRSSVAAARPPKGTP